MNSLEQLKADASKMIRNTVILPKHAHHIIAGFQRFVELPDVHKNAILKCNAQQLLQTVGVVWNAVGDGGTNPVTPMTTGILVQYLVRIHADDGTSRD